MPASLGGDENYIFFDGVNDYCTYSTNPQGAIKFRSHADAIRGSNGLADPWLPWQADIWFLQTTSSVHSPVPVYYMVHVIQSRTIHMHTPRPDEASLFFSKDEAIAYRERTPLEGDWFPVQLIDRP